MSIIKKLKRLKELIYKESINENNENRLYRLHYLYFNNDTIKEMHDWCCDTFAIPINWDKDDAFKIISYFFNHTNYETGSYKCCCETTLMLNKFGFKSANDLIKGCKPVDLFSVICNNCGYMFKNSEYYKQYFEWYHENITREEIIDICNKYNFEIPNIETKKISFTK